MCRQLAEYNLPETLVHGDFHGHNAAVREGQILVFDWTDAAISHPFMDLAMVSGEEAWVTGVPNGAARLYLERWLVDESPERLLEAFGLGLRLSALYQMVSYQGIVNSLEAGARWENSGGLRYFAKQLLKAFA
jgi:aminoglycoside phosphotransferase (APT) family kinase protein